MNPRSIFTLSVLILFLEMVLIRWVATEVNILAYLQNSILVVCFLGLGVGCAATDRTVRPSDVLRPLVILLVCLCVPVLRDLFLGISVLLSVFHDFVLWDQPLKQLSSFQWIGALLVGATGIFVIALLLWQTMLPLGVLLGRMLNEAKRPLEAYSLNIAGSLVGVWCFTLLGFCSFPPYVWFAVVVALILPWAWRDQDQRVSNVLRCALLVALPLFTQLTSSELETHWSPYQKLALTREDMETEYRIEVNNSGYQQIENNDPKFIEKHRELFPEEFLNLSQYDIPARLKPDAQEVLVVGAGNGNDVAGILRNTSANVTAVEIDPVILDLGKRFHPEQPYQNPRVEVVLNDARDYFHRTSKHFDLIVFGLLDSHTTSTITNARLDHFVYTREALAEAARLLKSDGVFVLLFEAQRKYIVKRLAETLGAVLPQPPRTLVIPHSNYGWGGVMFIGGNLSAVQDQLNRQADLKKFIDARSVDLSQVPSVAQTRDNWPYLYLESPSIPSLFLLMAAILLVLFWYSARTVGITTALSFRRAESVHFAALGAAFSLIEVYGIMQCAIIFGSTWVVNSVVISGILLMILFANRLVFSDTTISPRLAYIGVGLACATLYWAPFSALIGLSRPLQLIICGLLCGMPMLFSGLIFARSFNTASRVNEALGANMFGALFGGVLQITSMALGLKSLPVIAFVLYAVALATDSNLALFRKATASN